MGIRNLDGDIEDLCALVIAYFLEMRPTHGLALAWVVCFRRAEDEYAAMSRSSYFKSGRDGNLHMFAEMASEGSACLEKLIESSKEDPCFLLQFAAYLCTNPLSNGQHDDLIIAQSDVMYGRGISRVTLTEKERARFGLDIRDTATCVIPTRSKGAAPPIEQQLISRHFHTPGWIVVNEVIERGKKAEFHVEACPPSLRIALKDLARRPGKFLKVYVGELNEPPIFVEPKATLGTNRWIAENLSNDLTAEVLRHMELASEYKCDVVLLPELCIPDSLVNLISDWLRNNNDPVEGGQQIAFVVAGSFHKQSPHYFNEAAVLDANGDLIRELSHHKLTCVDFSFKADLVEGNEPGKKVTAIATALGLQSVVICLDLAQRAEEDKVPLEYLPISWLWVPSLSGGVSAHKHRVSDIHLRQSTTVICANQGPAVFRDGYNSGFAPGQSFVLLYRNVNLSPESSEMGKWGVYHVPISESSIHVM